MTLRVQRVRSVARCDRPRWVWFTGHFVVAVILRGWSYELWLVRY